MHFTSIDSIKQDGFTGFVIVEELRKNDCSQIANEPGVYMILANGNHHNFLQENIGGHFKGRNPTVDIDVLKSKWVDEAVILYIGKAGGNSSAVTLKARIKSLLKFGQGERIGHWGGRYLWQLSNTDKLLVCWKVCSVEEPRVVEKHMLTDFRDQHGKLPFANINC